MSVQAIVYQYTATIHIDLPLLLDEANRSLAPATPYKISDIKSLFLRVRMGYSPSVTFKDGIKFDSSYVENLDINDEADEIIALDANGDEVDCDFID
jgi:hypothetical protein